MPTKNYKIEKMLKFLELLLTNIYYLIFYSILRYMKIIRLTIQILHEEFMWINIYYNIQNK